MENNDNNNFIEIVMRQTNYNKETALEKLIEHKYNLHSIVREYMCSNKTKEKKDEIKSTSQTIYREIRNMMNDACTKYRRNKELEEYKQMKLQEYFRLKMNDKLKNNEENETN